MAEQLSQTSPDLLWNMIQTFAEALMSADADAVCGAGYGQRSTERTNTRNGYRRRGWDTRAGSIDLAIPKLREGSYFPEWLLERRRRAESALISVVATSYLLGVSTRRMVKLVESLGVTRLSRSQVSEMAKDFFGDLVARGLSGVSLVTSDLVEAIGATLPGASWQRCRTHYAANLMAATPKNAWGWVKALLHSVYDQPDADGGAHPVRPHPRRLRRQAASRRPALRPGPGRHSGVHRVPEGGLAADLV